MSDPTDGPQRGSFSRRALLSAGATAGVSAYAGCLGAGSNDGNLSVALSWDVTEEWTLEPYGGVAPYFTNVFETLTKPTPDLEIEPGLATEWELVDDLNWVFALREDVQFHDGTPFGAHHVVDRFQPEVEDESPEWLPLSAGTEITALDDHTVEFASENPLPALPEAISHPNTGIPHSDAADNEDPIGTGPLKVTDIDRGEQVDTEPFEEYWGETTEYDSVTFHITLDNSTRVLELEAGDADIAFELPWEQVELIEERDGIEVDYTVEPIVVYGGINRYAEPTTDRDLRRALNYAVSQSDLIDSVFQGLGEPARAPISPAIPWSASEEVRTYDYNPERASELVEQSSYDGEELELLVSTDVVVGGAQLAESIQASFDEIGVDVGIRLTERSAFFNDMDHAHISLLHYGSLSAGADYRMYASWHRNGINNVANYERDGTGLYNVGEDVDELIEDGFTTIEEDRTDYYVEAQEQIVEDAVILPIAYKEYALGISSEVTGVDAHPIMQATDFTEASPN
jgi:peptide/nickel transport system substrate-binding protein